MRWLLIGTLAVLALTAPAQAEARWPKLSIADGQTAVQRSLERDQRDGYSVGFVLNRCRQLSRRTVICKAVEYGVDWAGTIGEWAWWPRAMRLGPHRIRVYHPSFEPL